MVWEGREIFYCKQARGDVITVKHSHSNRGYQNILWEQLCQTVAPQQSTEINQLVLHFTLCASFRSQPLSTSRTLKTTCTFCAANMKYHWPCNTSGERMFAACSLTYDTVFWKELWWEGGGRFHHHDTMRHFGLVSVLTHFLIVVSIILRERVNIWRWPKASKHAKLSGPDWDGRLSHKQQMARTDEISVLSPPSYWTIYLSGQEKTSFSLLTINYSKWPKTFFHACHMHGVAFCHIWSVNIFFFFLLF